MKTKNIFIPAFIFVMAALLATPLMAQVNYSTVTDPEFEEYHALAEMAKTNNTSNQKKTYKLDINTITDPEFEEYHNLAISRNALFINAAKAGKLWKVKLFLSMGVNVNAVDGEGKTALMYAAKNGHTEVVKRLLKARDINVNAQDNEDVSALMFAVMNEHEDVVNLLVNKGKADKTLTSKKGFTAYDYALNAYSTALEFKNILEQEGPSEDVDFVLVELDSEIRALTAIMENTKVLNINEDVLEKVSTKVKNQNSESMKRLSN